MKQLRIIVSSIVALLITVGTPVALAATNSTPAQSDATSSSNTTTKTTDKVADKTTKKPTQAERITTYKSKLASQPTVAEQATIKSKCKASQAISTALSSKVDKTVTARSDAYKEINTSLKDTIRRLNDADVDTAELAKQQAELQTLLDSFATNSADYKAILADLNEIDCASDPVGFKATLESARTARTTVNKDMVAIRTLLETSIKKSLKSAQDTLSSAKASAKKEDQ